MQNRQKFTRGLAYALLTFAAAGLPTSAYADYSGVRSIGLYIGYAPGSGYDTYARLFGRHIGRFIAGGPSIVPRNMPGAGGMRVMNYIFEAAPKDGTAVGAVGRGGGADPLLAGDKSQAKFKSPLELTWIGSLNSEVGVAAAWNNSGVRVFQDAIDKPLVVASDGGAADSGIFPRVVNHLFGTKFRIVCCYGGGNLQNFAMEKGEVQARVGWSWSSMQAEQPTWFKDGKINVFLQLGLAKHPDIPASVPLILDLARSPADRAVLEIIFSRQAMGRPYIMPGGVPGDRIAAMRKAFVQMTGDAQYLADARKSHLEVNDAKSGEDVEALLTKIYASPPDVVQRAREAIAAGKIETVRERPKKKKKKSP